MWCCGEAIVNSDLYFNGFAFVTDAEGRLGLQLSEKTDSTDTATLLTLVLRTIQRLPKFAEAKSRQLLPLFLAFVGQTDEDRLSSSPFIILLDGVLDLKVVCSFCECFTFL